MYKEFSNHYPEMIDSLTHEEMCWIRIKDLNPNLTLDEFNEIVNQPDFDIENYEISKRISIETQNSMNMDLLRKRYIEFLMVFVVDKAKLNLENS